MSKDNILIGLAILFVSATGIYAVDDRRCIDDSRFISYITNPKKQDLKLYWKDDQHNYLKSIQNLKNFIEKQNRKLVFAMNAGMFKADNMPLGLFVENSITLSPLDRSDGNGNFYLKPNGVFFITQNNVAGICCTENFHNDGMIKYATQSGPMLIIDGKIHKAFKAGSENLNIRNGVGILPGNRLIFAMSKKAISFYDFANYFKSLGCMNALYLDGLVSRTYLPGKKWIQYDGNFGVIIGVTTGEEK